MRPETRVERWYEIDKVLLFCDIAPEPSADSNVLRVLERLGLIETGDYAKEYRAARALQCAAYGSDGAALRRVPHPTPPRQGNLPPLGPTARSMPARDDVQRHPHPLTSN